ncbi:MAG: Stk1 family PASTA domain-containing Ser/Thr kinase [Bacillota bacterium]|jgi:beta-lactam-binding protein with PASTA domain/predicted Ser/Thr protein kinase
MIGRILGNRYEILERVGGGGMAFVYRARDLLLNRTVAVKVLSPHYVTDEEFVRKFKREAQAAAGLQNPNIVGVYDVGQEGETYYIVMEFLEGKTLKQLINEHGPLPSSTALLIARQIAEALRSAHKHGVIHRDIKPHNIMFTADGHVKVTDFGIARAVTSSTLTNTGAMIGSVHYISPEQARGGFVGEKSDLYSLGVVLYELVTGQVPFSGDSMFSIALKHLQEPIPSPRELNPDIPVDVERIILKAMSKDQSSRYQSADELLKDLQLAMKENGQKGALQHLLGAQAEESALAPSEQEKLDDTYVPRRAAERRAPTAKKKGRPWWFYAGAAGMLLALSGIVFAVWMFWPRPEVVVPSVVGKPLSEAERLLTAQDLTFTVISEMFSELDPTVVISQDPAEGRTVRAGRQVALTISKGPEYADVPDVIGKTLREAEIELGNFGFLIAEPINYVHSEDTADTVIGQNPVGNTRVKRSTPIILTVSLGPAPVPFGMPDLRGLSPTAAQNTLTEHGLVLGTISGQVEDGIVTSQSPEPNSQVTAGQVVDLTFGPREITVIVEYTVPEESNLPNHQIEILKQDINGSSLEVSTRLQPGDTIRRSITGVGRLVVTVKDNGDVVKEEVYP